MKETYDTLIYNARKGFVYFFIILISLCLLLIFIAVKLDAPLTGAICVGCLFVLPFLLEKKIKKTFTTRVILAFDEKALIITISHLTDDVVLKELTFSWDKIKSYKVYFFSGKKYAAYHLSKRWNKRGVELQRQ